MCETDMRRLRHTQKPIYSHIQPCSGQQSLHSSLKQSEYPYQELTNAIHWDRKHTELDISAKTTAVLFLHVFSPQKTYT